MATAHAEIIDGIVLKKDLYKDNTLILKKGITLNNYLINKLNNFGIKLDDVSYNINSQENCNEELSLLKILIMQENDFKAHKTRAILNHAGYDNDKILLLNDFQVNDLKNADIALVFVDSVLYTKDLIDKLTLIYSNSKINIFVLNCDEYIPENIIYNTEILNVKFLYRPLANDYISALLKLYS